MIKHLSLKAYGKINLGLDVLRRREDGYHDVRMIMQTVGIFDRVDLVRKEEPGIEVETNLYYLPTNENNLVYKAAKLLMDEFQVQEGIQIRLRKFIPVAAGMAGRSVWREQDVSSWHEYRTAHGARREDRRGCSLLYLKRNRSF